MSLKQSKTYGTCLVCGDKVQVFASGLMVCKGCGATTAVETPVPKLRDAIEARFHNLVEEW